MFGEWFAISIGVLGGAIGLGGVIAYGKTGYAKNTNSLLRDNNTALEETNERLQAENKELRDRVIKMEGQIQSLTDFVTSRPEIEKLAAETLRQHQEVVKKLGEIANGIAVNQAENQK